METESREGRKQEVRTEPSYVGWSKAQLPWLEHTSKLKGDSNIANGGFLSNGRETLYQFIQLHGHWSGTWCVGHY